MLRFFAKAYYILTVPIAVVFILGSHELHVDYNMTWPRRMKLGLHIFWNTLRIPTATSYKSHLAMALKLLEMSPEVPGVVVECGTWKGGTAANLSLVCRIVNRKLIICDSFEGLPAGSLEDRRAGQYQAGGYRGTLDEVRANLARYGHIECCEFVKGWLEVTLPSLHHPVVLAYLDVDLEASLDCCVRHLWPLLTERGYLFIDEADGLDYCSLFFSERYWRENFKRTPPGLIGAGIGGALGEFYIGPMSERDAHPAQHHNAGAYTRKDLSGYWTYYPAKSQEKANAVPN
jgi:O-methyltransferase